MVSTLPDSVAVWCTTMYFQSRVLVVGFQGLLPSLGPAAVTLGTRSVRPTFGAAVRGTEGMDAVGGGRTFERVQPPVESPASRLTVTIRVRRAAVTSDVSIGRYNPQVFPGFPLTPRAGPGKGLDCTGG